MSRGCPHTVPEALSTLGSILEALLEEAGRGWDAGLTPAPSLSPLPRQECGAQASRSRPGRRTCPREAASR